MNDPELARLEQELETRSGAARPTDELRLRVARRVAAELRQPALDAWTYAGLAAAALVLGANLSWSVSRSTTFFETPPPATSAVAAQIREVFPELSPAEARRQALLLRGAARLPDGNALRRGAAVRARY